MNSETPPENVSSLTLPPYPSGSVRSRLLPSAEGAPPSIASNRRSAIALAMARALIERQHRTDRHVDTKLRGKAPACLLDPQNFAVWSKAKKPRTHIECRDIGDLAFGAHGDLGGAAADVDVHHHAFVADRTSHRAGAVGCHDGFQAVAGAHRHHLAGLPREQFADRTRVASAKRDAGEDQRAGVDFVRIDLGVRVLLFDKGAERLGVDRFALGVGRQQDVGAVERLALAHHIAAV